MKKLLLVAILAAAATALACSRGSNQQSPPAAANGHKRTAIHFTKNLDPGNGAEQYPAACIGVVTTEQVYGDKGDMITWKVKKNGGEGQQGDDCEEDLSKVNLRFKNANAVSPNPAYVDNNGEITVTVSSNEPDYNSMRHQKYQVFIDMTNNAAGPDPIIIVNCSSCGPGGGGPTE